MQVFAPPRYAMGKCSICGENLFLKEEAAAHLMGRLREIENVRYSSMAFGSHLRLVVYEEGGVTDFCTHEINLIAVFDNKDNKVQYLRE